MVREEPLTMAVTQASGQVATAAVNEVTGQRLVSRAPSAEYKTGWDRIFGKKEVTARQEVDTLVEGGLTEQAAVEHLLQKAFDEKK